MELRWVSRVCTLALLLIAPAFAGDYDHALDVIKKAWPERVKGVAVCNLEANQLAMLELVDTAKAKGVSLAIINLQGAKDLNKTATTALNRNADFLLFIDDDPFVGVKTDLGKTLAKRALARGLPVVALTRDALKEGAALAVGAGAQDAVYYNAEVIKKLGVVIPEGALDAAAPAK